MNALTLSVKKGDEKMYEDTQHQTDFFEEEEELSPSQVWDDVMADFFPKRNLKTNWKAGLNLIRRYYI